MSTQLRPARAVRPGDILKEEIEERGWTQAEFSEILGRPVQTVNEIIAGKKAITPETAVLLGAALGTSPQFWLNLESNYRLHLAGNESRAEDVWRRARIYQVAPVHEMARKGWIKWTPDVDELEHQVEVFFGVDSPSEVCDVARRFRLACAWTPETTSLIAWLRRAEVTSSRISAGDFDRERLCDAAPSLRLLSVREDGVRLLFDRLRELGVRQVVVPLLARAAVDGAAFWLARSCPAIALSLRRDRLSSFWFTTMHILAHLLQSKDEEHSVFVDDLARQLRSAVERQASRQAEDRLIPAAEFRKFVRNCRGRFSKSAVISFAEEQQIHPDIVVGRLQREKLVEQDSLRALWEKVSDKIPVGARADALACAASDSRSK